MKLATLKSTERDGILVVVNHQLTRMTPVGEVAPNLQTALEQWSAVEGKLQKIYQSLNQGKCESLPFEPQQMMAPLPRAYQWLDGSAYLSHVERVRKARGAQLPPSLLDDPLMYQGASDHMLGATEPIVCADELWGIDFEAEIGIITDDVPEGVSIGDAEGHIKLLVLINDVSFRNLIPSELAKGFGFIQGKPASAFSPVAVTPDDLNDAWFGSKLHYPLQVCWNNQYFGRANAGKDMHFDFSRLINHAAKTRQLTAGTLIGSGTVSNYEQSVGYSCIVEKRVCEIIETGKAETKFMHFGDTICIDMIDSQGQSIFGSIEQVVESCP